MTASAPGKVNLVLRVGNPDENRYHPLVSVFEAISLREYVHIERLDSHQAPVGNISVRTVCYRDDEYDHESTGVMAEVPARDNLAMKACMALMPKGESAAIFVHKTIPAAGGMAGGSADAAAALVAANKLWSLGLSEAELCVVGRGLGADVPACIVGDISLGTGYGDHMERLQISREDTWVLAFAVDGLSTPTVFHEFDRLSLGKPLPKPRDVVDCLQNDLLPAALSLRPELQMVGEAALVAGATEWMLCGSGPTIAARVKDSFIGEKVREIWGGISCVSGSAVVHGPVPGAQIETELPIWAQL